MPTTKRRLNISLGPATEKALARLAKRDAVPEATKAGHLIELALEIEKDLVWDAVASKRDTKIARYVSHDAAWE